MTRDETIIELARLITKKQCPELHELVSRMMTVGQLLFQNDELTFQIIGEIICEPKAYKDERNRHQTKKRKLKGNADNANAERKRLLDDCQIFQMLFYENCKVRERKVEGEFLRRAGDISPSQLVEFEGNLLVRYLKTLVLLYLNEPLLNAIIGQVCFVYDGEETNCLFILEKIEERFKKREKSSIKEEDTLYYIYKKDIFAALRERFTYNGECLLREKSGYTIADRGHTFVSNELSISWMGLVEQAFNALNIHLHEPVAPNFGEIRSYESNRRLSGLLNQETFKTWVAQERGWENLAKRLHLPKFHLPAPSAKPPLQSDTIQISTFIGNETRSMSLGSTQIAESEEAKLSERTREVFRKAGEHKRRIIQQRKKAETKEILVLRNAIEITKIFVERSGSVYIPIKDNDLIQLFSEEEGLTIPFGRFKYDQTEENSKPMTFRYEGGQRVSFQVQKEGESESILITYTPPTKIFSLVSWWENLVEQTTIGWLTPKVAFSIVIFLLFATVGYLVYRKLPPLTPQIVNKDQPNNTPSPILPQPESKSTPQVAQINDGGNLIEYRQEEIKLLPEARKKLNDVTDKNGTLMGGKDKTQFLTLTEPVGIIIEDTQPVFRWKAPENNLNTTIFYSVIGSVEKNSKLVSGNFWKVDRQLERGKMYEWQAEAIDKDGFKIPSRTNQNQPRAKFQVLGVKEYEEIRSIKSQYPGSNLKLGLVYAKHGLYAEAKMLFEKLKKDNPNSSVPDELLRQLNNLRASAK